MLGNKWALYILGPTAVGKTSFSIKLAKRLNTEIISADSRQFYRQMQIGTAKVTPKEQDGVTHHFINSLDVTDDYNVSTFENQALSTIQSIHSSNESAIIAGGSGLYLHSLWLGMDSELPGQNKDLRSELQRGLNQHGLDWLRQELVKLDEEAGNSVDLNNAVRMIRAIEILKTGYQPLSYYHQNKTKERPFKQLKIGLRLDRDELYERINERVDQMIKSGLIDEARGLLKYKDKNALKTVGYQELFRYFAGELSEDEAIEKIKVNSRRFAKRQLTWFRRYDDIHWFETGKDEEIFDFIQTKMQSA